MPSSSKFFLSYSRMISREDGKKEEMLRGAAEEEVVEEGLGLRLRIARFMKS